MILKTYYSQYPLNRKLTHEERTHRLHQNQRLDSELLANSSVIRMNSIYLECADRWFASRGVITTATLIFCGMIALWLVMPQIQATPIRVVPNRRDFGWIFLFLPIAIFLWFFLALLLRKESFLYTHYPIRFNRSSRKLSIFNPSDGRVIAAKWDDIFFTLGRCQLKAGRQNWEIRGHILADDGETVLVTFSLPGDSVLIGEIKCNWEFFRRYMEEGPSSVCDYIPWCHDIAEKRESFWAGLRVFLLTFIESPLVQVLASPVSIICALGRWFAMHTSRIPMWPDEGEIQRGIDPAAPFCRDASNNPSEFPWQRYRLGNGTSRRF